MSAQILTSNLGAEVTTATLEDIFTPYGPCVITRMKQSAIVSFQDPLHTQAAFPKNGYILVNGSVIQMELIPTSALSLAKPMQQRALLVTGLTTANNDEDTQFTFGRYGTCKVHRLDNEQAVVVFDKDEDAAFAARYLDEKTVLGKRIRISPYEGNLNALKEHPKVIHFTVLVTGLHSKVDCKDTERIFADYKPLYVAMDEGSARVVFDDEKNAKLACKNLNGRELDGRKLTVKLLTQSFTSTLIVTTTDTTSNLEDLLEGMFSKYGPVLLCDGAKGQYTIVFEDYRDAQDALELDGDRINGHRLAVRLSTLQQKKPTANENYMGFIVPSTKPGAKPTREDLINYYKEPHTIGSSHKPSTTLEVATGDKYYGNVSEVKSLFTRYGPILSCDGEKGWFKVVFEYWEDAQIALQLDGQPSSLLHPLYENGRLSVKLLTSNEPKAPGYPQCGIKTRVVARNIGTELLIGGLYGMTDAKVRTLTERYGDVKSIRPRLMYVVEYKRQGDAEAALHQLDGKTLNGTELDVTPL